jgi:hypothetical protein
MSSRNLAFRISVVVLALALAFSATAPGTAHAQAAALTSIAHTYSGTYTINGVTAPASFTLVRGIRGGYEATAKLGAKSYLATVTFGNGLLYVNIFRLDKNYNQVYIALISGTLSPDLTTITGNIDYLGRAGTVYLTAK